MDIVELLHQVVEWFTLFLERLLPSMVQLYLYDTEALELSQAQMIVFDRCIFVYLFKKPKLFEKYIKINASPRKWLIDNYRELLLRDGIICEDSPLGPVVREAIKRDARERIAQYVGKEEALIRFPPG